MEAECPGAALLVGSQPSAKDAASAAPPPALSADALGALVTDVLGVEVAFTQQGQAQAGEHLRALFRRAQGGGAGAAGLLGALTEGVVAEGVRRTALAAEAAEAAGEGGPDGGEGPRTPEERAAAAAAALPDCFTYCSTITALGGAGRWQEALQVLRDAERSGGSALSLPV